MRGYHVSNPLRGSSFLTLLLGIAFGFGLSSILNNVVRTPVVQKSTNDFFHPVPRNQPHHPRESHSDGHLHRFRDAHSHEDLDSDDQDMPNAALSDHSDNEEMHKGQPEVAQELAKRVRILCWVLTNPNNHQKKAIHLKQTWGKRCNKLIFMSTVADPSLPSVALYHVPEGRDYLWGKTKEAFLYVYKHHFEEADWFLKVDDDTYIVMENLRYFLKDKDPKTPVYYGCRFKLFIKQGYMSGGAGYVLSKEALKRFVERGIPNPRICKAGHTPYSEDVEIGKCMEKLGVEAGDTRDSYGRYRFHPLVPSDFFDPGHKRDPSFWYDHYIYYPQEEGFGCCSDTAISFHYVSPTQMYFMEFFLYHLIPYGIGITGRNFKVTVHNQSQSLYSNSTLESQSKRKNRRTHE